MSVLGVVAAVTSTGVGILGGAMTIHTYARFKREIDNSGYAQNTDRDESPPQFTADGENYQILLKLRAESKLKELHPGGIYLLNTTDGDIRQAWLKLRVESEARELRRRLISDALMKLIMRASGFGCMTVYLLVPLVDSLMWWHPFLLLAFHGLLLRRFVVGPRAAFNSIGHLTRLTDKTFIRESFFGAAVAGVMAYLVIAALPVLGLAIHEGLRKEDALREHFVKAASICRIIADDDSSHGSQKLILKGKVVAWNNNGLDTSLQSSLPADLRATANDERVTFLFSTFKVNRTVATVYVGSRSKGHDVNQYRAEFDVVAWPEKVYLGHFSVLQSYSEDRGLGNLSSQIVDHIKRLPREN